LTFDMLRLKRAAVPHFVQRRAGDGLGVDETFLRLGQELSATHHPLGNGENIFGGAGIAQSRQVAKVVGAANYTIRQILADFLQQQEEIIAAARSGRL